MYEMQIDIKDRRPALRLRNHMGIPNLFKQRPLHRHSFSQPVNLSKRPPDCHESGFSREPSQKSSPWLGKDNTFQSCRKSRRITVGFTRWGISFFSLPMAGRRPGAHTGSKLEI